MPPELRTVYKRLAYSTEEVRAGTLDPQRAMAMAALARAMVAQLGPVVTCFELAKRERDECCAEELDTLFGRLPL
ncbi:MAG: hypothetical protein GX446_05170 [Chthonomonadales bacterium]|nr:hypothetical protein [Chthonomonadales bacterium]